MAKVKRSRSTEVMLYEGDAIAYFDDVAQAWCCGMCDAVLKGDGDCPRCDGEPEISIWR